MSMVWVLMRFVAAWSYSLGIALVALLLSCIIGPTRAWLWARLPWAKGTLWLVGVRVVVHGGEHLRGPAVFVSNHESLIDDVVLPAVLPAETRFVAKRELLWVPLWGWMFAAGGALLIDRHNSRRARASLTRGLRRLPKNWSLVVFPEGTRSRTPQLLRFKSGAFHLAIEGKLPMVPIGLAGTRQVVAPEGWLVRGGTVHVVVGAPIVTTHWRSEQIRLEVARVQSEVEQLRTQAQNHLARPAAQALSCATKSA